MAFKNHQISPQYLYRNQVTVTILDVINPVHFIVRESPSLDGSSEAKNFIEAEAAMQKFYDSLQPCVSKLPLKDTIVVALVKEKFYRARVITILSMSPGYLFRVYLVDYGKESSVPRECIYEIEKDFLYHPFQAVNFKLLGVEPISLIMNPSDLTMSYGPVSYWDSSAEIFVQDLLKGMCNAYIEILAVDKEHIYGKLFISYENNMTKCINDELISNKFAQFNESCWENVQKIGTPCSKTNIETKILKTIESLKLQDSNPKQVPESSSVEQIFNTMFISPTDGKVVAKSSLKESKNVEIEDSLHKEIMIKSPKSSSPVSDVTSEQLIAQEKFRKLQKLNKKQLRSAIRVSDSESTVVKNIPAVENNSINKENSPKKVTLDSSSPVATEAQTVGQQKFLKLQKLCKKQLQCPSPQTNIENSNSKQLLSATESVVSLQKSPLDFSSKKTCSSTSEMNVNQNGKNLDSDTDLNKLNVSPVLVNNLSSEQSITEAESIAQKKFQKLQQLHKKKLQSLICSYDANFSKARSISPESSKCHNEDIVTNIPTESTQSNILNKCVEISSEDKPEHDTTSEVVVGNVRILEKLQNRIRMKKMKPPLQVCNKSSVEQKLPSVIKDKCDIVPQSKKLEKISSNIDRVHSSSSLRIPTQKIVFLPE